MEEKEKKVFFSKEVDSKISGIALGFAFLSIGVFLLICPDYFGNEFATNIIRWIFIVIGALGLLVEFSKNKNTNIKGADDFLMGAVLLGIWTSFFIYTNNLWISIINFFLLLIALYGLYMGSIKIIYSIFQIIKTNKSTKKGLITDIILLITRISSLALVIVQIIKALEV